MRIDILTLFPDTVYAVLHESIIGRAAKKGILEINCVQIRDFTENKQCQVDDYPYGGGWGCVMMAQPLKSCLDHVMSTAEGRKSRVIYLSPQGKTFTQETAKRLRNDYDHLVLVCGHYEGVDERFIEKCVDEELSLGDFVLTGGEIAAMAVADSVCRLVPGVLSDEECYTGESHWDGLLEYPQYTRPEEWEGLSVPEVLRGGDHAKIVHWRRKQQLLRTRDKRPDLFEKLSITDPADLKLLEEIQREALLPVLDKPLSFRRAVPEDLPQVLSIAADAKAVLKKRGIDQWQGAYPNAEAFLYDIGRGECWIAFHGEEPAGIFTLTTENAPGYDAITDGKWTPDLSFCVIHRLAVSAKYRGTAVSAYLFRCVEEIAHSLGVGSIRVDTHKKNKSMKRVLNESGYRYRGNISVLVEPGHDPARQAFEKVLN
ncbi:MAG: tRNA (guanosine(37)-N1)-methyltransferase TrmD [Oscillospiraceae bacterium]|nr:tRNA (guanosine(37)-N1)-methyltransferase TrmD [Oscillospiraceae bacterium]